MVRVVQRGGRRNWKWRDGRGLNVGKEGTVGGLEFDDERGDWTLAMAVEGDGVGNVRQGGDEEGKNKGVKGLR